MNFKFNWNKLHPGLVNDVNQVTGKQSRPHFPELKQSAIVQQLWEDGFR